MSKIPGILALCPLELAKRTAYNIFEKINECIMKILKFYKESGLLIKGASETIRNETK